MLKGTVHYRIERQQAEANRRQQNPGLFSPNRGPPQVNQNPPQVNQNPPQQVNRKRKANDLLEESEYKIDPCNNEGHTHLDYETEPASNYLLKSENNIVFYKKINEDPNPVVDIFFDKRMLSNLYNSQKHNSYFKLRSIGLAIDGFVENSQIKKIIENPEIRCVIISPIIPVKKIGQNELYNIKYFPVDLDKLKKCAGDLASGGKRKRKRKTKKKKTKRKTKKRNKYLRRTSVTNRKKTNKK
jgi:hypothetical protein